MDAAEYGNCCEDNSACTECGYCAPTSKTMSSSGADKSAAVAAMEKAGTSFASSEMVNSQDPSITRKDDIESGNKRYEATVSVLTRVERALSLSRVNAEYTYKVTLCMLIG